MAKLFWLIILVFWPAALLQAQVSMPVRVELPYSPHVTEQEVFCLPDSTLLLYSRSVKSGLFNHQEEHSLQVYNKELQQVKQHQPQLPAGSYFLSAYVNSDNAFLLFSDRKEDSLLVLNYTMKTGAIRVSQHKAPSGIQIVSFKELEGNLFVLGTEYDQHVRVWHQNLGQPEGSFLPAIYEKAEHLSDFTINEITNQVEFVIVQTNGRYARLQVKQFSPEGDLLQTWFVPQQAGQNLLDAQLIPSKEKDDPLLVGTYTLRDLRYSQGLFTAGLASQTTHQYFDFTDFDQYFNYLPERAQARIKKKINRLRAQRRQKYLRHRVLLHDPIPHPEGYVLVGEVYQIQYRTSVRAISSRDNLSHREFEGYRHSHAIVCLFDSAGNLKWDYSYDLDNFVTKELEPVLSIGVEQEKIILANADRDELAYKVIKDGTETFAQEREEWQTLRPKDRLENMGEQKLSAWYNSHFLVYGYQRVRNKGVSQPVFYLQKVCFEGVCSDAPTTSQVE